MQRKVQLEDKQLEAIDDVPSIHHIPAKINSSTVDANIQQFFYPTIRPLETENEDEKDLLSSTIRGRPLKGMKVKVPSDSIGVVFNTDQSTWTTHETFTEVIQWALDSHPQDTQIGLQGVSNWMELSKAVHSEIDPSEMI